MCEREREREGGWIDSPGRMELCSLLSRIHSNVQPTFATPQTHTHSFSHTHTHTHLLSLSISHTHSLTHSSTCGWNEKNEEKGYNCLDFKIEIATQQRSLIIICSQNLQVDLWHVFPWKVMLIGIYMLPIKFPDKFLILTSNELAIHFCLKNEIIYLCCFFSKYLSIVNL